jgi:hypothetical protein
MKSHTPFLHAVLCCAVLCCAVLCCAVISRAGHFAALSATGTMTSQVSGGATQTSGYFINNSSTYVNRDRPVAGYNFDGGNTSASQQPSAAVSFSGTVTTKFIWVRDQVNGSPDLSDKPPKTVIAYENSSVDSSNSWSGFGVVAPNPILTSENGLSSNFRYQSETPLASSYKAGRQPLLKLVASDGTVTHVSNQLSGSVSSPSYNAYKTKLVYCVYLESIVIYPSGTTKPTPNSNLVLPGQGVNAAVGVYSDQYEPTRLATHRWNIPGSKFDDYRTIGCFPAYQTPGAGGVS